MIVTELEILITAAISTMFTAVYEVELWPTRFLMMLPTVFRHFELCMALKGQFLTLLKMIKKQLAIGIMIRGCQITENKKRKKAD